MIRFASFAHMFDIIRSWAAFLLTSFRNASVAALVIGAISSARGQYVHALVRIHSTYLRCHLVCLPSLNEILVLQHRNEILVQHHRSVAAEAPGFNYMPPPPPPLAPAAGVGLMVSVAYQGNGQAGRSGSVRFCLPVRSGPGPGPGWVLVPFGSGSGSVWSGSVRSGPGPVPVRSGSVRSCPGPVRSLGYVFGSVVYDFNSGFVYSSHFDFCQDHSWLTCDS